VNHRQKGFTPIEIAIVLVIIGLLLGGVVKGQEMISASRADVPAAWPRWTAKSTMESLTQVPFSSRLTLRVRRLRLILQNAIAVWSGASWVQRSIAAQRTSCDAKRHWSQWRPRVPLLTRRALLS
jgi:prepilin-type N-terminal cleavage/methylation domain-containing protein